MKEEWQYLALVWIRIGVSIKINTIYPINTKTYAPLPLLMFSKTIVGMITISMFSISVGVSAALPIIVKVAVKQDLVKKYQNFLEKKQKQAIELTHMDMSDASKGIIRLVILEQALHKAGLVAKIELVSSPNAKRSQLMVQSGEVLVSTKLTIDNSTPKDILKSSELPDYNNLIRGVYGLKSNHALMNVKTLEGLRNFSAVTTAYRDSDINTLQEIDSIELYLAHNIESVFKMVSYRDIDFTLLDVEKENERKHKNMTLFLVPGLLIQTDSSMHYFISAKHQHGQMVHHTLEKGLAIMSEQGLITKYFHQISQLEPYLQSWNIININ